ncbi:MAG TPA: RNase adapter RapZ [Gammaproteobacteria bacterium]|nr:RNase adapter RapZ [Gammaproteobacteria bacterium]
MKLVVISGLSGSGKTVALHTLEDEQYYCVDNLPPALLPVLVKELRNSDTAFFTRTAVGIDARTNIDDFQHLPDYLRSLRADGVRVETVFLHASDDDLIKRFSETRRRHPLSAQDLPLREAIRREREILTLVRENADLVIDTTNKTVHELRKLVIERISDNPDASGSLALLFQSFGFKYGVPGDTDFIFDVRCLPNPHWIQDLRPLSGKDAEVQTFLRQQPMAEEMLRSIRDFLDNWLPRYQQEQRRYMTVSIGCNGGKHRSVYICEKLAEYFRDKVGNVSVRHREIGGPDS